MRTRHTHLYAAILNEYILNNNTAHDDSLVEALHNALLVGTAHADTARAHLS